eukprot:6634784-Pyramimonas_sp.AAC.1
MCIRDRRRPRMRPRRRQAVAHGADGDTTGAPTPAGCTVGAGQASLSLVLSRTSGVPRCRSQ